MVADTQGRDCGMRQEVEWDDVTIWLVVIA